MTVAFAKSLIVIEGVSRSNTSMANCVLVTCAAAR